MFPPRFLSSKKIVLKFAFYFSCGTKKKIIISKILILRMGLPIALRIWKSIKNKSGHLKKNNFLLFSKLELKNCAFEWEIKLIMFYKIIFFQNLTISKFHFQMSTKKVGNNYFQNYYNSLLCTEILAKFWSLIFQWVNKKRKSLIVRLNT